MARERLLASLFGLLLAVGALGTEDGSVGIHGSVRVESRAEVAEESHKGIHSFVNDGRGSQQQQAADSNDLSAAAAKAQEGAVSVGDKANDNGEANAEVTASNELSASAANAEGKSAPNPDEISEGKTLAEAADYKKAYEKAKEDHRNLEKANKAKWEKARLDREINAQKYDAPSDRGSAGDDPDTRMRIMSSEKRTFIDPPSNQHWEDEAPVDLAGMEEDLGESNNLGESNTEQAGGLQSRMYDILGLMERSHAVKIDKSTLKHQKEVHTFDDALAKHERVERSSIETQQVRKREEYEDQKEDYTMDDSAGNTEYQGLSAAANMGQIGSVQNFGHLLMYHEED